MFCSDCPLTAGRQPCPADSQQSSSNVFVSIHPRAQDQRLTQKRGRTLDAVVHLMRRLLPAFRAQRHGRIVVISSETTFAGQPAISPYCASKWAAEGWAELLAYELEPFNIQISLIEPGRRARTSGRARRGSFQSKAFTGR